MNPRSFYLLCLRAYPAAFRERHGAEMLRIFEAEWRTARDTGLRATLECAVHVFSDLVRTVPHERFGALTHDGWLADSTATFCGLTATWAPYVVRHGNLSTTVVVLFTGSVFFSYFAGVRTWRWPITAAAWIPSTYLFLFFTNEYFRERLDAFFPLSFFGWALITSSAGTGVGILLRRLLPLRPDGRKSGLPAIGPPKPIP